MGMDQRQRRREGSQRAQASRERRAEARQRRKQKSRLYMIGGAAAVAVIVAALVLLLRGTGADVGFAMRELGGFHGPPFFYNQDLTIEGESVRVPPTSGNHFAQQSPSGFLGEPIVPEAVVHNMEHGSVVIWYQPDNPELAANVSQLVRTLGDQCIIAGSYTDMSVEVAATAWGRVLPLRAYDESELRSFIIAYRGERGPEAGICRRQS